MWRLLLARTHPDHGGSEQLFIWTRELEQHVRGDELEEVRTGGARREAKPTPSRPTSSATVDRLDFTAAFEYESFADLTAHAVGMASEMGEPFASLLRLLVSCYAASAEDGPLWRAQHTGASYKQLAFVAHLCGMGSSQRTRWYRIAESIPLSQAHAGHLIRDIRARAA